MRAVVARGRKLPHANAMLTIVDLTFYFSQDESFGHLRVFGVQKHAEELGLIQLARYVLVPRLENLGEGMPLLLLHACNFLFRRGAKPQEGSVLGQIFTKGPCLPEAEKRGGGTEDLKDLVKRDSPGVVFVNFAENGAHKFFESLVVIGEFSRGLGLGPIRQPWLVALSGKQAHESARLANFKGLWEEGGEGLDERHAEEAEHGQHRDVAEGHRRVQQGHKQVPHDEARREHRTVPAAEPELQVLPRPIEHAIKRVRTRHHLPDSSLRLGHCRATQGISRLPQEVLGRPGEKLRRMSPFRGFR
mmetsp:Transcript_34852/g.78757  ORF Transcript_34852/g.78757 Transcript_34852/m.78757 type:complete len:303 (-) Transcript_34852:308-1216(-)